MYASPTVSRTVILLEWLRGLHVPLVSRIVIQLTWQCAGDKAFMGFPFPVYASPTVSRMVIAFPPVL